MEHQKKNYQELGLDSLKDGGWLRYLCYLYKIVSTKMPPYFYEILPLFQKSQCNPVCFKAFNIRTELFLNSFLPFTISEWNTDPGDRKVKTYSLFRKNLLAFTRPIEDSIYRIYDILGIKLLHRLRLGFSHLREHKFRHNFPDNMNPLCSCYL